MGMWEVQADGTSKWVVDEDGNYGPADYSLPNAPKPAAPYTGYDPNADPKGQIHAMHGFDPADPYGQGRPESVTPTPENDQTAKLWADKHGEIVKANEAATKAASTPRVTPPGMPGSNRISGDSNRKWAWKQK